MPRLFTALEIPAAIADQLTLLQGGVPGARWIEGRAFHLTLRFIGDIEPHQAQAVHEALEQIKAHRFKLSLAGIDSFGGKRPSAIWAGVPQNPQLAALQSAHERAAVKAGLAAERRKFTPHVTLARLRKASAKDVASFTARHGLFRAGPFDVERFVLFSSTPSRGGGPYVAEHSYPLNGNPD